MINKIKTIILVVVCLFFSSTTIYSQHNDEHNKTESHDHFSKHHIALFNGATTNFSHKSTAYTVGLDYEFRFSRLVGCGISGEYIASESGEILAGIGVFLHPYKGTKLIAGPFLILAEEAHSEDHESKKEASISFRIGVGYDFHFKMLSVGPIVNFDVGNTEAINYGLAIGIAL